jgi:hypothetical protein
MTRNMLCTALGCILLFGVSLYAEAPPAPDAADEVKPAEAKPAPAQKLQSDIIYLDPLKTVKINKVLKTVEIPAEVCITRGPVEVALGSVYSPNCRSHESIFVTHVQPELIHAALMAIELKPGKGVDFNGQDRVPTGSGVYVYVEWDKNTPLGDPPPKKKESLEEQIAALEVEVKPEAEEMPPESDGKKPKLPEKIEKVRIRLEDLILNKRVDEPLSDLKWIFTGSRTVKTRNGLKYDADIEGTVIATWHCSSTVIDIPLPEGSDDEAFHAHKVKLPPKKTPVTFIFSADELKSELPRTGASDPKPAPKAADPEAGEPAEAGGDREPEDKPGN